MSNHPCPSDTCDYLAGLGDATPEEYLHALFASERAHTFNAAATQEQVLLAVDAVAAHVSLDALLDGFVHHACVSEEQCTLMEISIIAAVLERLVGPGEDASDAHLARVCDALVALDRGLDDEDAAMLANRLTDDLDRAVLCRLMDSDRPGALSKRVHDAVFVSRQDRVWDYYALAGSLTAPRRISRARYLRTRLEALSLEGPAAATAYVLCEEWIGTLDSLVETARQLARLA